MSTDNNETAGRKSAWTELLQFTVYSNLFIAGCAVVMVIQTYQLIIKVSPDPDFILFVLFSTICSYSFHWWLTFTSLHHTSRLRWLKNKRWLHLVLFIIGAAGSAIYFFRLLPYWHWLLITSVITFLYSAPKIPHPLFRSLRKVALGKTIFLSLVWMNVTTLLPMLISGSPWKTEYTLFIIHRYFLIYAICILFDYRDRDDDIQAGIKSLITYLDLKGIFTLFTASIIIFIISTILLFPAGHYPWFTIVVLLLPGLLAFLEFKKATQTFADMYYYLYLDGLMALSSFIMFLPLKWTSPVPRVFFSAVFM